MLTFRRANPDDAAQILEITRESYQKWCAILGREPMPMTADYHHAVRHHVIELAFEDGRMLGLAETIPCEKSLLIKNLAVRPAAQGRGLGKLLLKRVEDIARELELRNVTLYTNKLFQVNIDYYSRRGYVFDREEKISDGWVVHMSKSFA
jgi:N-acetylglutamate synthase-like GNAT family acetyltransferase